METADRRLTLVSSSLEAGGAERVASTLANRWSDRGISVHIITYSKESAEPFYELDPRIALTQLNIAHPSLNVVSAAISNVKRIIRLRRTILSSQPDVVISFLTETNVLTLMAMFGTRIPVIVTEHTDPEICRMSSVWSKLRGFTYRFANNVVVLNRHIQDYFWDRMRIRTTIIPNPIVQSEARRNVRQQHTKQIVSVGRFAAEKRFELLVRAFYRVSKRCPDWNLIIIGDGPQRPDIRELAEELGISDRVLLPGPTKDPEAVLRQSKIFVSTSVQEGFPMALCEAMANGLA
ncbi:MAG: glycosyltransferase, partial [Gammaproteobacteria bacterium]|nr:glycosyltransferase [Gammaproteobacteria bacterium]